MGHRKGTHTHEGKRVGEHADDTFEKIHEGCDQEHANTAFNEGTVTFRNVAEQTIEHQTKCENRCEDIERQRKLTDRHSHLGRNRRITKETTEQGKETNVEDQ